MNTETLKEGTPVTVTVRGQVYEGVVAKTTPYKEEFPFVLVATAEGGKVIVNRRNLEVK